MVLKNIRLGSRAPPEFGGISHLELINVGVQQAQADEKAERTRQYVSISEHGITQPLEVRCIFETVSSL